MRQSGWPRGRLAILLTLLALPAAGAWAAGAEIVMVQGQGQKSDGPTREAWVPASQGDRVEGGYWVRTLVNSQMGLTIPERNQIRLNQNSELQVKTAAETAQFRQTRLNLVKGRAWSQARPRPAGAGAIADPTVAMETPSATLSIRGTDWEVEVAEDGSVQVVVLSGRVDVENAQGALSVGKGEAARAEPGKAPQKLVLVDPESRVQWVSSWQPRPARWIGPDAAPYAADIARIEAGDYAAAQAALTPRSAADAGAAVLLADLQIYRGDIDGARATLRPHAGEAGADDRAAALDARALARLGRIDEAAARLARAVAADPGSAELRLAEGEIARLRGDAAGAQGAFDSVLAGSDADATGAGSRAAEAWYGLGLMHAEREFVRAARRALQEALALDPGLDAAAAELAAVETFAGNLQSAAAQYDALLARQPADYLALTGRGINALKRGEPDAALADFMKAGLVEPRYARAWLYQGVAFYQLGERERALQAFAKAGELDANDPVPHMMASQVAADALDFGAAIAEARQAQAKMPFLKSLNQLQNDQKGSANLGSPIANFGMEEWARYYADEAYSPFWAGSHLFLADRYTGAFTKNSELFKGYLTDPLAFGASNRYSSLVQVPGHYGKLDVFGGRRTVDGRTYWRNEGELTLNGQVAAPVPAAYFANAQAGEVDQQNSATQGAADQVQLGLGVRPLDDLGVFVYAVDADNFDKLRTTLLPDTNNEGHESTIDGGLNLKLSPENQFWLKGGSSSQQSLQSGAFYSRDLAQAFDQFLSTRSFSPEGMINQRLRIEGSNLQFRHAFSRGDASWSWGAEMSRQAQDAQWQSPLFAESGGRRYKASNDQTAEFEIQDTQAYVSGIFPLSDAVDIQTDLFFQDADIRNVDTTEFVFNRRTLLCFRCTDDSDDPGGLNPRVGLRWRVDDSQLLRLVAQRWQRPASFGTLSPVDTLGIVLDDDLTRAGGELDRIRFQYDAEIDGRYFVEASLDHEAVDNGLAGSRAQWFSLAVEQLQDLRQVSEFFQPRRSYEAPLVFRQGSLDTAAIALNALVSERVSVRAAYLRRNSDDDSLDGSQDERIAYVPRDQLEIGARWSLPGRVLLGADAVYRGSRGQLIDTGIADSGWSFDASAYWESPRKEFDLTLLLRNFAFQGDVLTDQTPRSSIALRATYRFQAPR